MKRWGRYVNPNTRRSPSPPIIRREGNATVIFTGAKRGLSHRKKYVIDWRTWYIFLWLVSKTVRRHPKPFNKTAAGKRRRAERRFKQEQRYGQEINA